MVLDQVQAGVAVRMAVLYRLLAGPTSRAIEDGVGMSILLRGAAPLGGEPVDVS